MRIIDWAERWNLIRMYCFRRFFLNVVLVCAMVFSTTVAWTSTTFGCTKGRPVSVKLSLPTSSTYKIAVNGVNKNCHQIIMWSASSTFSKRILSPIVGAQYPSMTTISPAVTLYCFPHRWTTANKRPSARRFTTLLTFPITDPQVFFSTMGLFKNSTLFAFSKKLFFCTTEKSTWFKQN